MKLFFTLLSFLLVSAEAGSGLKDLFSRGASRILTKNEEETVGSRGGSRILAKNEDEAFDMDVSDQTKLEKDRDAPLMRDIDLLSDILSEIVNTEDPVVHDLYKEFRQLGLDRAADPTNEEALRKMISRAKDLTPGQALGVMRTFSIMLNLVNAAEVQHRRRVTRQHDSEQSLLEQVAEGPLPMTEDSIRGTMDALLKSGLVTKDQIYDQIISQKVEIVLTAHPTQVQRKSLLRKYRKIAETLGQLDRVEGFERTCAKLDLKRVVSSVWGVSTSVRREETMKLETHSHLLIFVSSSGR
jgi:phosphoenolpyruvate carboxylase